MNVSLSHFEVIESLDLDRIKLKLTHVESGEGWSQARAEAAETEYRRFLHLMRKYPEARIAPTVDVDMFWHYHILDTVKYARDCEYVFGYFLHHDPYVGLGADASPADQVRAAERMIALYEAEFGASPVPAGATAEEETIGAISLKPAKGLVHGRQRRQAGVVHRRRQPQDRWRAHHHGGERTDGVVHSRVAFPSCLVYGGAPGCKRSLVHCHCHGILWRAVRSNNCRSISTLRKVHGAATERWPLRCKT